MTLLLIILAIPLLILAGVAFMLAFVGLVKLLNVFTGNES